MRNYFKEECSMRHYLKSKNGEVKYTVDMNCGHPNMKNNNTQSVGCNGACSVCRYGTATLSLHDFYEIMKYADINFKQ